MKLCSRSRLAFTLVELLVTMAVIALLASLLLGGLNQSKSLARSALCKSNQRQIGIGLRLYVDDRSRFPDWSGYKEFQHMWYGQLMPYVLSRPLSNPGKPTFDDLFPPVFVCTVRSSLGQWNLSVRGPMVEVTVKGTAANPLAYGYNLSGTLDHDRFISVPASNPSRQLGLGYQCSDGAIQAPAKMVTTGCGGVLTTMSWSRPLSASHTSRFTTQGPHRSLVNVLFCDGHTESLKRSALTNAASEARRIWNRDFEPHPETWD